MKRVSFIIMALVLFCSTYTFSTNYFVNDNSTVGDVYCTAPGAFPPFGDGSMVAPYSFVFTVLSNHTLLPGDTVFIETGTYNMEIDIIGIAGAAGNPIVFTGIDSTKTIIYSNDDTDAKDACILIDNSEHLVWQNMKIIAVDKVSTEAGIWFRNNSNNVHVQEIRIVDSFYGIDILSDNYSAIPNNIFIHDSYISATYVGVRIKADAAVGQNIIYGPHNIHLYDNTIILENTINGYAPLEMQATHHNFIYRNRLILSEGIGTGLITGAVHFAQGLSSTLFYNNYIISLVGTNNNYGVYIWNDNKRSFDIDFFNNSIYSVRSCFYSTYGASGFAMMNNILHSELGSCYDFNNLDLKLEVAKNNLYYHPNGLLADMATNITNLAEWQAYDPDNTNGNGDNSLDGLDPLYIDPDNYMLDVPCSSPAVARGFSVFYINNDINETPRTNPPTIGAYEMYPVGFDYDAISASCSGVDNGSFTLSITDGNPNYDFTWSHAPDALDIADGKQSFTSLATGNYFFTVVDDSSCVARDTVKIGELDGISIEPEVIHVSCEGLIDGELSLTASNGTADYIFEWPTGTTTTSGEITLENLSAIDYTITITDNVGCEKEFLATITEPVSVNAIFISKTDVLCVGLDNGEIEVTAEGGTTVLEYNYEWNNGDTDNIINGLVATTYILSVTDDNGCLDTLHVVLTEPLDFDIEAIAEPDTCDDNIGSGMISITSPEGEYLWGQNSTTGAITGLLGGESYIITVINNNGCSNTTSLAVDFIGDITADFLIGDYRKVVPFDVLFTNNTPNGTVKTWYFDDDQSEEIGESIMHNYLASIVDVDSVQVILTAISEYGCIDSSIKYVYLEKESLLEVPNVFSPMGSLGANDTFLVNAKGIEHLEAVIYNRWGKEIYDWTEDNIAERATKGWTGYIRETDKMAPPGVYYYLIKATGYDEVEYDFAGPLHLFRSK